MKTKDSTCKPNWRLIATGFFASTTCWFVVDNFILPVSIGKYIIIEIVMGIMGALYDFEQKRLRKNNKIKSGN
jgi:hypothetical protein